jgi:hypothetical protein
MPTILSGAAAGSARLPSFELETRMNATLMKALIYQGRGKDVLEARIGA